MKRTPLRSFSARRTSERDKRREVVGSVLERDGYRCQAPHDRIAEWGPPARWDGCYGPLDVHEVVPRSAWAGGYLDPTNCMTLARSCHRWVDAWPAAAHALGLHKFSWERAS